MLFNTSKNNMSSITLNLLADQIIHVAFVNGADEKMERLFLFFENVRIFARSGGAPNHVEVAIQKSWQFIQELEAGKYTVSNREEKLNNLYYWLDEFKSL
jgi:hypothetical protein